jgi:hydrogenase-4 component F
VGILALGVGLGGVATFGAMLHALNHSLTKAMLFLVSGNILAAYRTKTTGEVRGMLRVIPASGVLWLVGFFAIVGAPPFGLFLSEFTILKGALDQGRTWVAVAYLALLGIIFVGMASAMLGMAQGEPSAGRAAGGDSRGITGSGRMVGRRESVATREAMATLLPPALLAISVLVLGLYIPPLLRDLLAGAARTVAGF